jgi:hypothetical protein
MTERRIFLSYDQTDVPFVESVAASLKERGVETWFDRRDLPAGQDFSKQLRDSLQASNVVVVFVGKNSESPWLNFELGAALGQSKLVLPIFLSHHGHQTAPAAVKRFQGIEAFDLTPEQVAERIAGTTAAAE